MILLLTSLAFGADDLAAPLIDALEHHPTALQFGGGSPSIYHLRYHLITMDGHNIRASFGALLHDESTPYNRLSVETRVGDASFDNTGFFGWENGFSSVPLPDVPTPRAVDLAAWRISDVGFKNAVEQYSRKKAQIRILPEHPGDYTLGTPIVHEAAAEPIDDTEKLRDLAVRLSAVFKDLPLERGSVVIATEAGKHEVLDSEGSRVSRPQAELAVRAIASIRTEDGHSLTDQRLWTVRNAKALPSTDRLVAEVRDMADQLVALADAPLLDDEVVGPVLFTDAAARDLFKYLLLPQLEGTPPEASFNTFFGETGEDRDSVRVGRRVLPPGWQVFDDPTADLRQPGSFTHDIEGTPARRVHAVHSGVVRELLMSRVPRKESAESTGHARGGMRGRASARPSDTHIIPPKRSSARQLHRTALKIASAYGRDWYLRVDQLTDPAVAPSSRTLFGANESPLPPPLRVIRVNADGSEQVLRGARFASVERWVLRDIAAAGPSTEANLFIGIEPGNNPTGPTHGLPVRVRAPDILIGEIEVLPAPPNRRDAPVIPHPTAR